MSRKDYIKFAKMVKAHRHDVFTIAQKETLWAMARGMCSVFKQDDPNFDRDRFMEACGFNDN